MRTVCQVCQVWDTCPREVKPGTTGVPGGGAAVYYGVAQKGLLGIGLPENGNPNQEESRRETITSDQHQGGGETTVLSE